MRQTVADIDETARIMNRCRNMAWGLIQDRLEDSINAKLRRLSERESR